MSAIDGGPRDYSPSRIKYRMERIWLTPIYRSLIRTGVPIAILVGVAVNHFSKPDVQKQLAISVQNAWAMVEDRPEFAVKLMRIQGGSDTVANQVREAVPMGFPQSSLKLDVADLKRRIEAIDAVKQADVFLRAGVLEVLIEERVPAVIWRGAAHLELVDGSGARAGIVKSRKGYETLPLILGPGAQIASAQALELLAVAGPIRTRIRALRRMGQRRWDVLLDRGQVIQLPVQEPVHALERLVALQLARDVLGRDVSIVDLRDGRRPVLRLSPEAVSELQRLRAIADQEEET